MPECRVAGEQAILALNRGDYLQAMDLLYRGKALYWADVADVAERVLTVDELKGFVDKHAPAPTTPPSRLTRTTTAASRSRRKCSCASCWRGA